MAGADVAEVPRGHAEGHLFVIAGGGREPALEVIDHLGQHAGPVDGIDGTDPVLRLEGGVVGDGLDDVLGVVEHAAHGDVEDVFVLQRVHLGPLEGTHPALGGEHEDLHVVLAAHGVLGRRTRVAGGSAEDVDVLAALVQHVLEQVAEELHGHILEGQCRPVREFQQVEIGLERCERGDVLGITSRPAVAVGMGGVGPVRQVLQVAGGNVTHELLYDAQGERVVREFAPFGQLGLRDFGVILWQVEATVGGQSSEQDVAEVLRGNSTAGGYVFHRSTFF